MKQENTVKNGRRRFWCLLGLLILLILVRYALQIDIPRAVFLLVIGLLVILGNRDEIVAMCICCIPMHESIDFYFALVICICVYVLKYYKNIRVGTNVLLVLIIVIWELLHCFLASFSIVNFLSNIIPFIVLAVLMASDAEDLDYPFIVCAFSWATLGISCVLLVRVFYFADFDVPSALAGLQRLGSDKHSNIQDVAIAGGQINPNSLGIITVIASTGLMQLRSMKCGKKSDMILMCVMIIIAALSTSRTYLACLAMMIILLVFSEKGGLAKKLRLIAILCLALAAAVVALAVFFPDTFEYFISRFITDDITTGRDGLMEKYHQFIVSNPRVMAFGIGLQEFGERLTQFYRVANNTPHNSIQEIIIAWGVPGLFLFAVLILNMYDVSYRRNRSQSLVNWIPMIIILFKGLAGQMLTSSYTMLALSFAYLSLCTDMSHGDKRCILPEPKASSCGPGCNINYLRRRTTE